MSGDLSKDLKKVLMAGLGAITAGGEKSAELFETLAKKGEETFEHGKVVNEELKHNIKETIKNNVTVEVAPDKLEEFVDHLSSLSEEDLAKLKAKLTEVETAKASEAPAESVKNAVKEMADAAAKALSSDETTEGK